MPINATLRAIRRVAATAVFLAGALTPHTALAAFETSAPRAILVEATTGAVLFEKDADALAPPASVSKLMTLAITFRALKEGRITLDTPMHVSEHAWRTGGGPSGTAAMFAKLGSEFKVSELIRGIAVQSANDAAIILAEGLGKSEDKFAEMMTAEARALGLSKSTFGNATGLPHPKQLMTVREIAILARHLITTYPEYYGIFSERVFEFNNGNRTFKFGNRNPLLSMNIGADGLKTGFIKEAGYNLVGSAVQNKRRLIVVVAGAASAEDRSEAAKKLIEWGFRNFKEVAIFEAGEIVGEARVWGGSSYYLRLVGGGPVRILVPRAASRNRLKAQIVYQWPLKPPIRKGDQVASLRVEHQEAGINFVPLYAAEDVEKAGVVGRGLDTLFIQAVAWLP